MSSEKVRYHFMVIQELLQHRPMWTARLSKSIKNGCMKSACGGTQCRDNLIKIQQCYGSKAVDCKLSYWSEWSGCTTSCGVSGTQSSVRHRTTEQCGSTCSSSLTRTRSCQQSRCFNERSLKEGVCFCRAGFSGDCCELQGN